MKGEERDEGPREVGERGHVEDHEPRIRRPVRSILQGQQDDRGEDEDQREKECAPREDRTRFPRSPGAQVPQAGPQTGPRGGVEKDRDPREEKVEEHDPEVRDPQDDPADREGGPVDEAPYPEEESGSVEVPGPGGEVDPRATEEEGLRHRPASAPTRL